MPLKTFTVERPLDILGEGQVEMIHAATLDILETTGLVFEHERALEVLSGAGCRVDRETRRVRFPPHLVEESLRKCPSSFSVCSRERRNDLRFGGRSLHFMPWAAMDAVDLVTGARVVPTTENEIEAVRLMDALDVVHAHYGAYFNFEGVHPMMSMPVKTSIGLRNSSKLQATVAGFDWDLWQIKMGQATGQEMIGTPTGSPPLTWGEPVVESVFRYVEAGRARHAGGRARAEQRRADRDPGPHPGALAGPPLRGRRLLTAARHADGAGAARGNRERRVGHGVYPDVAPLRHSVRAGGERLRFEAAGLSVRE
jgi:hypothetical protein